MAEIRKSGDRYIIIVDGWDEIFGIPEDKIAEIVRSGAECLGWRIEEAPLDDVALCAKLTDKFIEGASKK